MSFCNNLEGHFAHKIGDKWPQLRQDLGLAADSLYGGMSTG